MRYVTLCALLLSSVACVSTPQVETVAEQASAADSAAETAALAYPQSRRVDVVEPQFGVNVADPYRWLENDVRNDNEVRAWVTAQNRVTDAYLDKLPLRDAFKARMTELYDYERY